MFQNYLKTGIRQLWKDARITFLNILGLGLGLAACLAIFLFVRQELSYDTYHAKADRIFRIVQERQSVDEVRYSTWSPVPLGPALDQAFPQIEKTVRFWRAFQPVLHHRDEHHQEDGLYFTDPAATEVFDFEWLAGDPAGALANPNSIVLTESAALRYFGNADPVGQTLRYEGYPEDTLRLEVTGLIRDLPEYTHLEFTALASLKGVETDRDNWGSFKPIWTYVLLEEGVSAATLEADMPAFIHENFPSGENSERERQIRLETLTSIHLYSEADSGFKAGGDITYVYLFSAIGLFVLFLACINFINLATARSFRRAREVGVRKVLGARRGQLVSQFLGEAFIQCTVALVLAFALLEFGLPLISKSLGRQLDLHLFQDGRLVLALLGGLLLVGLLAGGYPALYLSRFRPASTLKGKFGAIDTGAGLRRGLVVFQFAVSIGLMIATVLVYQQLQFIRQKNLGFDKEQVLVLPYTPAEKSLLNILRSHPGILEATVSQRVPVNELNFDGRALRRPGTEKPFRVQSYIVDEHFLDTYRIPLVAGREFSPGRLADSSAFLLNETAVRTLGWEDPQEALDQPIEWSGQKEGQIIGIVKDFHTGSLHDPIEPLVMHTLPRYSYWRTWISVRIRPGAVAEVLPFLEKSWRQLTPEGDYSYFFIDESLDALHRADSRFSSLVSLFAGIALLIACLGLWGLAAFSAERRNKEIGVRKVFGAASWQVILLLSRDFAKLIIVGLVVAAPLAWWGMNTWLDNFAYRIEIDWWVFALTGLAALFIAMLTIGYHTVRAARRNPVEAIRYE